MNGILVVDKPQNFTSFDVIAKLRGVLGERRIGHGGTLDPMATGVLPLYIGSATKAADLNPATEKRYEGKIRFGIRTDTGDIWGTELESSDIMPCEADIRRAAQGFVGGSMQTPPMYSAVKINGQKLIDLARKGKTVERPARHIEITEFEITVVKDKEASFTVSCSKGTYIRVLAEDLAKSLGALACLSQLRRTLSGGFSLADAFTLDDIIKAADAGNANGFLLPVERAFMRYPKAKLTVEAEKPFLNGAQLGTALADGIYRVEAGDVFALAIAANRKLKKLKSF